MKKIICAIIVAVILIGCIVYAQENSSAPKSQEQRAALIKQNLDKVNLSEVPGILRFILGKPKINIEVDGQVYGFKIAGEKIQDFVEGGLENPNYLIILPEEALDEIIASGDVIGKVTELYKEGVIVVKPQTIGAKIKFWFAKNLSGWFT